MTRTWGLAPPFCLRAARCLTPKRCCSSTTASARRGISTPSWMRAWVPMMMSRAPSETRRRSSFFVDALVLPVSNPTDMGFGKGSTWTVMRFFSRTGPVSPPRSIDTVEKCWSASTSVGTMMEPWWPLATAARRAAKATTVFPLPTSPCRRRFMGGVPLSISTSASFRHLSWAPVKLKGREVMKLSSTLGSACTGTPSTASCQTLRRISTAIWMRKNSSKAKRLGPPPGRPNCRGSVPA